MAPCPPGLWDNLQAAVCRRNFSGDEFIQLKAMLSGSVPAELNQYNHHAAFVWDFLFGVAEERKVLRKQVGMVVQQLCANDGFRNALLARPNLETQIAGLHASLREDFASVGVGCGAASQAPAVPKPVKVAPAPCRVEVTSTQFPQFTVPQPMHVEETDTTDATFIPEAPSILEVPEKIPSDVPQEPSIPDVPTGTIRDLGAAISSAQAQEPADLDDPEHHPVRPISPEASDSTAGGRTAQSPLVRRYKPFIQLAAEIETENRLAAHCVRFHAIQQLVFAKVRRNALDNEAYAFLLVNLEEIERKKQAFNLQLVGARAVYEAYVLKRYEDANKGDVAGSLNGRTMADVGLFVATLAQFYDGGLPPHLHPVEDYCRARSGHLRHAQKHRMEPDPPRPPASNPPPAAVHKVEPPPVPSLTPSAMPGMSAAPQPVAAFAPATTPVIVPVQAVPVSIPEASAPRLGPAAAQALAKNPFDIPPADPQKKAVYKSWNSLRRQDEACKKASEAIKALESGNADEDDWARVCIIEALHILEE